ncbi:sialin-like [Atheta coriaria]|uniref:sialin-like n=1 Tax=Dalotia coriaria TaxID=877792 RepID=UPI0031F3F21A
MKEVTKTKKPWFTTRDVLWYMVFSGFAINYMLRINLNIAIVSMVPAKPPKAGHLSSECLVPTTNTNTSKNGTLTTPSVYSAPPDHSEHFNWDEYEQSLILGSYFWLYWLTQLPGGILAQKYGTKIVFGLSNLAGCLLCFVMPIASHWGPNYLIFVRILQGFVTGFSWPSMHNMTARWIPPNERSKFVTAYLGSSLGAGLTFPMCGYIIANYGWELVFHVCGIIGCVWYVFWHLLVFDTPAEHPRISNSEKEFIQKSLGRSVSTEKKFIGIQMGLSGFISVLPGFISPTIVGVLTNNNQTVGQWQKVFFIAAGMLIVPAITYVLFAKSELQEWNDPLDERKLKIIQAELEGLRVDGEADDRDRGNTTSKEIKHQEATAEQENR